MLFTRRHAVAAGMGALAVARPGLARAADNQTRAVAVVGRLLADAHKALSGTEPDAAALRTAVAAAFAFNVWERFLIGDQGGAFSAQQHADFQALLPGFMAGLYMRQFGRGLDQAPRLGAARAVRRDIIVASTFPRTKGGTLPVEWRVRDIDGQGPQVIDVMVAGTSFLLLKKEEFGAILGRGGAAALLAHMRENTF